MKIKAYTDGSCLGNPGVGGYAAIMQAKGTERICRGYDTDPEATNNRMELKAVICVVDWCNTVQKEACEIQVCTDSQYLVNCHTHKRSWLTSESRPNHDLWLELIEKGLKGGHHITFVKVAGHSDCEANNRADKLAREMAVKARHEVYGG
jgi:ribonuclease HI